MQGLLAASLLVAITWLGPASGAGNRLICYYTNWPRYRSPLARFTPANINPYLCTHIHYFAANTNNEQQLGPSDPFSDITKGGYREVNALKKLNPQLKTMLTLGGSAGRQQGKLQELAVDPDKRKAFIQSVVAYLREHGFDGFEMDWKEPEDGDKHALLLEEMMTAFVDEATSSGKPRLLLSATLPADTDVAKKSFDIPRALATVDYSVLILYNFHSSSAKVTGHHAPLFSPGAGVSSGFADATVDFYRELNVPMEKLIFGVPTFGITFTLKDPAESQLQSPASGPGYKGKLTLAAGSLAFFEICEHVSMDGWTASRPKPGVLGPYAVRRDQWVAYDDQEMMKRKGKYIQEVGLGGAAVWTLAQDDFRGFCTGKPYPLIEAIKEGMSQGQRRTTTRRPPTTPAFDNTPVFSCPHNGKFAKPDDCSQFYFCDKGVVQTVDCPAGQRFYAPAAECRHQADCTERPLRGATRFDPTPPPQTSPNTQPGQASTRFAHY